MDKFEFIQWIHDNYNVPSDDYTMAPEMLENILDYAEEIAALEGSSEGYSFLSRMFPSLEENEIRMVAL